MDKVIFVIMVTFFGGEKPYTSFDTTKSELSCAQSVKDFKKSNFDQVFKRQAQAAGQTVKSISYECVDRNRAEEIQDATTEE